MGCDSAIALDRDAAATSASAAVTAHSRHADAVAASAARTAYAVGNYALGVLAIDGDRPIAGDRYRAPPASLAAFPADAGDGIVGAVATASATALRAQCRHRRHGGSRID